MVISVRNCMVGSRVDTLYCARFLTGGRSTRTWYPLVQNYGKRGARRAISPSN